MRIATWNINGLRARLDFLLLWLAERQPDVVGLQELKLADDLFPHEAFEAAGYHALSHGQKSWNGVAILTREAASCTQRGLPGQEDFGARMISAEVGGFEFATLYCPNGKDVDHDDYPRKLAWFDALASFLEKEREPQQPLLLCGDFNICCDARDSWDEEGHRGRIFHTDAERACMRRLLEWGLVDLFRDSHPEEPGYSWWDYRGGAFHRNHGLRIDLLLASASLHQRLKSVGVDRDWRKKKDGLTASDHAPVVAELE